MRGVWVVALVLGCTDERASFGLDDAEPICADGCDDQDPCTDDRCVDGRCVFVPSNALKACETDLHCDDGHGCTTDSCEVDACGFQRCVSRVIPLCEVCDPRFPLPFCQDTRGCRFDGRCVERACEYRVADECDPVFDADADSSLLVGPVELAIPCVCPCSSTNVRVDGVPVVTEPELRCDVTCEDDVGRVSCTPIAEGLTWIIKGERTKDAMLAEEWRVSPESLNDYRPWDVTIEWSRPLVGTSTFTLAPSSRAPSEVRCSGACPTVERVYAHGRSFIGDIEITLEVGLGEVSLVGQVYPQPDGLAGPVFRPQNAGSGGDFEGTIVLTPRPD